MCSLAHSQLHCVVWLVVFVCLLLFLIHSFTHFSSMDQGKMFLFIGVIMILVQGESQPLDIRCDGSVQGLTLALHHQPAQTEPGEERKEGRDQ